MLKRIFSSFLFLFVSITILNAQTPEYSKAGFWEVENSGREVFNFNIGWRFVKSAVDGAEATDFNDSNWEVVNCPHGLELISTEASGSNNYQGEVWYRKHFTTPEGASDKILKLHFEGVMGKSKVWLNGELLAEHFGGYLPFTVDFEEATDDVLIKNMLDGWQWGNSESLSSYYLDFKSNATHFIAASSYMAGEISHVKDIATTMPLRLADYSNVKLSFDYMLITGLYSSIDELHVVYKLQDEKDWHEWHKLPLGLKWTTLTLDLPQEAYKNGTQIGFYYDDFYQKGMGAGLDNISITGTQSLSADLAISNMTQPVSSCILS